MVPVTMQVPEDLANRIRPIGSWLPTILELGLHGYRTPAAATAAEIVEFLTTNPAPQEVFDYHVTARAQSRLQRLLALNQAGLLGEQEKQELDESQRIEHTLILLKARLAGQVQPST